MRQNAWYICIAILYLKKQFEHFYLLIAPRERDKWENPSLAGVLANRPVIVMTYLFSQETAGILNLCPVPMFTNNIQHGPVSISDKTSYRKISRGLEPARWGGR